MALRFIADRMLGKLAKQLRMLGYDTLYYRGDDLRELIRFARKDERMVLTRNTHLKPETPADRIVMLLEDKPWLQARELIQQGLTRRDESSPFSRCLICNMRLSPLPKSEAQGKVPEFIFYEMKEFSRCGQCQRIYWQGTHHGNMEKRLEALWGSS